MTWFGLVPGAQAAEVVTKGEAELGIAQASEIVPVAGAQLVGPLPGELASTTVFTGGIGAGSKSPEAAKALIRFLSRPEAASHLKTKGFEPGWMSGVGSVCQVGKQTCQCQAQRPTSCITGEVVVHA